MFVNLRNVAGLLALRLKTVIIVLIIQSAVACSNNPHSTPPIGNVSETTKNPLADLTAAAAAGKPLYISNCASCHGDDGKGEGDFGPSLPVKPSNLTRGNVVSDPDGKMFLVIKNGKLKDGKINMPPARGVSDEQIWQIVSYVRTLAENKKED